VTGTGGAAGDAPDWAAQGFGAEQAEAFRRWRFTLDQAVAWRQAGVPDGLRAAQWTTAGVTPDTVNAWRAAGIDASQAVHWHELGFDLAAARDAVSRGLTPNAAFGQRYGPVGGGMTARSVTFRGRGPGLLPGRGDTLRRLREAGVALELIHGYLTGPWAAEDALPWAQAGIEAADAVLWRTLGVSPAEAARLTRKGACAADTVRDWWRAGIPFDEAADWIGAGLSAQEAVEQRARGITAEQAAALRALRDQDADE
jgi:hypothetical protein